MEENYFKERAFNVNQKCKEILKDLPDFCEEFVVGIEQRTSPLTRLNYLNDLKIFFNFLTTEIDMFNGVAVKELTLSDLDQVKSYHIEKYLSYLTSYKQAGKILTNDERAKARKLSSVRSMFKYFFNKDKLSSNVASKVETPKLHEKPIIRLEGNEVEKILDEAEYGDNLTKQQLAYNKLTRERDTAILTTLLGTGMRVSELVGINKNDINFDVNGVKITRKGGNQTILYFGNEVRDALLSYIDWRKENKIDDTDAMFLTRKGERLGVRAVEKLVKKYASVSTPLKKITPHKLRSTYGTNLYKQTKDIYIVADVLGHKDVNTTKKHYTAMSEDIRKDVANAVKLRKD